MAGHSHLRIKLWTEDPSCKVCGIKTKLFDTDKEAHPENATIDHIVPKAIIKLFDLNFKSTKNIRIACYRCNQSYSRVTEYMIDTLKFNRNNAVLEEYDYINNFPHNLSQHKFINLHNEVDKIVSSYNFKDFYLIPRHEVRKILKGALEIAMEKILVEAPKQKMNSEDYNNFIDETFLANSEDDDLFHHIINKALVFSEPKDIAQKIDVSITTVKKWADKKASPYPAMRKYVFEALISIAEEKKSDVKEE